MAEEMDSYLSFRNAQGYIDSQVKLGKMTREKAKEILDKARVNYRNQSYNRQIERLKR